MTAIRVSCTFLSILILSGAPAQLPAQTTTLKRYLILTSDIRPENGHCYIATMDFGEDGDRDTNQNSRLQVFENGKPLGPGRSLHQEIRESGAGRFSHWSREHLYFSTSDNSDPRTNGRRYEVASTNPQSELAGLVRFEGEPKTHTEVITSGTHDYTLMLGGSLDHENTRTHVHSNILIAFQPNLSLTIENTGQTTVMWPKLIANHERDWSTFDSLLEDFTRGAANDQEIAYFIWQRARKHRYHAIPLFADDEFHDPVKMFNSYGLALCDDMGYCGASLFKHAGLGRPRYTIDPKIRSLHGHMMCEAVVDDQHQFLDIDQGVFFLDRESDRPVSGDECAHDHDLVRREVAYGPVFRGWDSSESNATLFGPDDTETYLFLRGHEMRYRLRPGEKAVFRWDNIDKWACQSEKWNHRPPYFGNSKFVYRPRLTPEHYHEGIKAEFDILPATAAGAFLAGGSPQGRLVYDFDIPWAICGGTIRANFIGRSREDFFALEVSLDGKTWVRVWEGAGAGLIEAEVVIDQALQPHVSPAKYHYSAAVILASADDSHGANLKSLEFETDVMAAPLSLPGMVRGENRFTYTDLNLEEREITVTHEWQECYEVTPPNPPAALLYPPDQETIRDSVVTFRWQPVEGARAYHLQVSRREDFLIPYRPSYDVIISTDTWTVPYTGMFKLAASQRVSHLSRSRCVL